MIDEAPLLTIRKTFERPQASLVAAFKGVPTAQISDAMHAGGAMDFAIKAPPGMPEFFIGTALTCDCGPGDNLAVCAAVALAEAGDVIVAATHGFTQAGIIGDLLAGMMQNREVAAFVTDGVVRDVADLRRIGLPVFAKGAIPSSVHRSGPGTVGLPIVCGGIAVESGDILIGDPDGVVVVPRRRASEILERLKVVRTNEGGLLSEVTAGLDAPGFAIELLAGSRVRYLD